MILLRVSCETCGYHELAGSEIFVVSRGEHEHSYYGFSCPACEVWSVRAAPERVRSLLAASGVTRELAMHPRGGRRGAPLGALELESFQDTLAGTDLLVALVE